MLPPQRPVLVRRQGLAIFTFHHVNLFWQFLLSQSTFS
jgi:hypothetical protein